MSIRSPRLLAGTALFLSLAAPAYAEDAPPVATPSVAADDQGGNSGDDIVVLGFGQARQVQTVSDVDLNRLTPGTTPIKAIEKLPGVNYQAADAFGAYEWSSRISLRGFNQNQLGFTLDGIPLGDMSYGNSNGLHISRAIISENLGTVTVAQGAGALGEASTSNLGGTLQFTSRNPADHFDIVASGTYGSDQTIRAFARVESGDLTGNGLKAYLSYGFLKTDKWKGYGEQRQHQVNAKVVQELGDTGSISAFFNFSDRRENDYQDLSLDIIKRLGLRDDNISNNFPLAQQIARVLQNQATFAANPTAPLPWPTAGLTYPSPYQTADDAYFDAAGLRRDYIGGATFDSHLTDNLSLKVTGYFHDNHGQGLWYTPYVPTPGGSPLSVRTTEYDISRGGAIARLGWDMGVNHLEVGGWYESNNFHQARRYYGLLDQATPSRDSLDFQKDPFRTDWDFRFTTDTTLYYVSDRLELGDLTLTGGWKGYQVTNKANPIKSGGLASGSIEAKDWFLPQAGAVYKLGNQTELFATFTQNMRAFTSTATGLSPFATTQAGFDAIKSTLKPERSNTYEVGGRFRAGGFQASVAGYYVDFSNRLLALTNGAGIVGNPVTLQNVGDVRNYGAELTLLYKVMPAVSLFGSYAYNKSEYRDNVLGANGAIVTATKGKTVVDSPEHMLKGEIVYDDGHFLARVGADYMSKRYFTYTNDQSVPGRVIMDATIGYTFGGEGFLKGWAIEGSVTNLTGKKYISTIGSNGFTASGDNQTLLAGAPRQFFVTLKHGF
jgi:iron complex outermembrane receptor protein